MKKMVMLMIIFFATAAPVLAQEAYYVQSMKAKIMSGPSFKAAVVGTVAKGHKLEALSREKSWVKVRYNNREGYVASLLVSSHPPLARVTLIKADDDEIKRGVRRRASTYTSAAAARGLTADDRRRLSAEGKVDYAALEKIEAFTVGPDEVTKFMEGGR